MSGRHNLVENAIRPAAVGKKNWRFVGHPEAGKRTAVLYSIIISCQRHGKEPLAYLRDVLARLPRMTNQDDHPQSLATGIQRRTARIGYEAPILMIVKLMRTPI